MVTPLTKPRSCGLGVMKEIGENHSYMYIYLQCTSACICQHTHYGCTTHLKHWARRHFDMVLADGYAPHERRRLWSDLASDLSRYQVSCLGYGRLDVRHGSVTWRRTHCILPVVWIHYHCGCPGVESNSGHSTDHCHVFDWNLTAM